MSAPPGLVKEKSCAAVNTFLLVLPSKWTSFKRPGDDKDGEFTHYIQDESEKYMQCVTSQPEMTGESVRGFGVKEHPTDTAALSFK